MTFEIHCHDKLCDLLVQAAKKTHLNFKVR